MKKSFLVIVLLVIFGISLYLINQAKTIYGGDGGDLVTAALVSGIPHPPGYPLYTFLGFLLTKLPFSTPSYRVAFLSSFSSIGTLIVFFLLIKEFVKSRLVSVITCLTLGTLYLFWLYSVVPEVFALNNLFFVLLVYFFIRWLKTKKEKYLFPWFFILGLSLTHHHTILLILPPSFYYLYRFGRKTLLKGKFLTKSAVLFLIGLSPYLYLPIAASFSPPINWDNPVNLPNFIHLVTRAGYGTFKIGSFVGNTIQQRLLSFLSAFQFFYKDFRLLGTILIFSGLVFALRQRKREYNFFLYLLFLYLFFLFYASFPLYNDFLVGTFERFLIIPIILLTFFLGLGVDRITALMDKLTDKVKLFVVIQKKKLMLFQFLFLVLPFGLFLINFPKIAPLRNELLLENMATAILDGVEKNSILIASTDTTLFSTLYVYYWKRKWPEVKLIHSSRLNYTDYRNDLKKRYPDLWFPDETKTTFALDFFEENAKRFPLYSIEPLTGLSGEWLPYGLTFRYFPKSVPLPSLEELIVSNNLLWSKYPDPLKSSVSQYKNLLLSDTLRVYAVGRESYGLYLFDNQRYDLAEEEFKKALGYSNSYLDTHLELGKAYLFQNKCNQALEEFNYVYRKNPQLLETPLLLSATYGDCLKDPVKKEEFLTIYDDLNKKQQLQLEKL